MPPTTRLTSAVERASLRTPQSTSAAVHDSVRRDRFVLSLVLCALVLLYTPTIIWLFDRWTMSVWHNGHGLFIPPVVGYFVYQELRDVRHLPASSSALGFALLMGALLLHVLDTGMHTQLLSAFSIVVALPGLALLFLGPERTRRILFPLAFLLFMLPIPLGFTKPIHLWLRQLATEAAAFILPQFGIPTYTEQTTIQLPNSGLIVADACSGFSTLYAALAIACLVAYTTAGWPRRLLVLALAAPLAIAANVLRVAFLAMLVYWQGADVLATSLHTASGILTFALALPPLFWLGRQAQLTPR